MSKETRPKTERPQAKTKQNTGRRQRQKLEDARDLRDARRELARAKREGVIPLHWLIEEIEGLER